MTLLSRMLDDEVRPNRLQDIAWLNEYEEQGQPAGAPLLLALGETWDQTPPALLKALQYAPPDTHGYQMSMYGLPALRQVMKQYVQQTQRLPADPSWELAVSWTGTRSAMRDFAVDLRSRTTASNPTVLAVAPPWDYAGFLEPLGYRMAYVETSAQDGFRPSIEEIRATVDCTENLALVVINAQHNPTGNNWQPEIVRALVQVAVDTGSAVLVDDAYYGICPNGVVPTSATAILLEVMSAAGASLPWLAVRSFGKQFHCNGWGLGAVLADPTYLDDFVNDLRAQHTYNYGAHLQHAMAQYLTDGPAVHAYLSGQSAALEAKREMARAALEGAEGNSPVAGPAAPYALFAVPETFAGDGREYLHKCAVTAGVLMSPAWPTARPLRSPASEYVRMYLGPEPSVLAESFERLNKAGLLPG